MFRKHTNIEDIDPAPMAIMGSNLGMAVAQRSLGIAMDIEAKVIEAASVKHIDGMADVLNRARDRALNSENSEANGYVVADDDVPLWHGLSNWLGGRYLSWATGAPADVNGAMLYRLQGDIKSVGEANAMDRAKRAKKIGEAASVKAALMEQAVLAVFAYGESTALPSGFTPLYFEVLSNRIENLKGSNHAPKDDLENQIYILEQEIERHT